MSTNASQALLDFDEHRYEDKSDSQLFCVCVSSRKMGRSIAVWTVPQKEWPLTLREVAPR